jgi:Ca-activated chloride channel family protein
MKLRALVSIALAAAVALLLAPVGAQPQRGGSQPSFRTGIDVVSLNVAVTDAMNRYVTDLDEPNFEVFEDGVKQDLILFNRTNLPISLSLLIDTSSSMEDRMSAAQEAAIGFVRQIRPTDVAEIIGFDSRVEIIQKFTNNVPDLEVAIRKTVPGGSTSLFNALYIALKGLKSIPATQTDDIRRQAIILLSDGEDTSSLVTFEEVLDLARRSETAIYTIGLVSSDPVQSRGFREAIYSLRQLASDTGGRSFFPNDVKSLVSVYAQIRDELSSQYTIGYPSKNVKRDGAWRRLVVRTDRPNTTARTKQGYFGPTR